MDKRLLSLGKYNIKKPTSDGFDDGLLSECYFDWIELNKIDEVRGQYTSDFLFGHEIIEKTIAEPGKTQKHIQESMILVSDSDRVFLIEPKCVYISMINIPMWKEDLFRGKEEYVSTREQIFSDISERAGDCCKLFHSFDHCDLILVADGEKISFSDYMSALRDIRKHSVTVGRKTIKAILDITTIYGYTKDYVVNSQINKDSLSFTLEINFKTPEYNIESFQNTVIQTPDLTIETIGRYDALMIWKNVSWSVFDNIVSILKNNHSSLYTYRIIIGEQQVTSNQHGIGKKHSVEPKNMTTVLPRYADETFKQIYSKIENNLEIPLSNALIEIQNSIITMLHSGFAQYYTLSFYESYYSFLRYINRLYRKLDLNTVDKDERKRIFEMVYDLFRLYFGYLNALNACTIHSERQFLQTDSYQLLYFDASPKLIAFYTALANKIVSVVEKDSRNNYTFLITPDFKSNIFVESLTHDRTIGNERNILIIHADENSLYNLSPTVRIITHEIFHHIGQKPEMRRYRAKLFLKSSLAFVLAQTVPNDVFKLHDESISDYQFFSRFVDCFFASIFNDIDINKTPFSERFFKRFDLKVLGFEYDADQESHYLTNLSRSFLQELMALIENKSYKDILLAINMIITKPLNPYIKALFSEEDRLNYSNSGFEGKFLTEYSNSFLAELIFSCMNHWLMANTNAAALDNINHTFRESFADLNMINLICGNIDHIDDWYVQMMLDNRGDENPEEYPRIFAVLKALDADTCSWAEKFKELCLKEHSIESNVDYIALIDRDNESHINTADMFFMSNYGMFYYYLAENAAEYLDYFQNSISDTPELINLRADLSSMVCCFDNGSVQDIVNTMDREIFKYRKRLISSQENY